MSERDQDYGLLRQFTRRGDQAAFAALVRRHLDLVYATALRKLEDPGAAEEVAQNVFASLARKAWQFAPDDSLPAWLYRATLLEAKGWLRGELRRRRREQTAAELGTTMKTADEQQAFRALLPLLDEALLSLYEKDRLALLLRFYESRSLREVGTALGLSDDAAQKRVATALERLAQFFQRRGFKTATLAATTAALQNTASSAPATVAASVVQAALHAAPPALAGLGLWLARLANLTKLQKVALGLALVGTPAVWHWTAAHAAHASAAQSPAQPQVELAQQPAPPMETQTLAPRASVAPGSKQFGTPALPVAWSDKEYDVRVTGLVALPDFKAVLLEVHHHSLDRPNTPPFIVKRILREGQLFDDMSVRGAYVRLEIVQIDTDTGNITARENGEDRAYALENPAGVSPPPWENLALWLPSSGFNEFVDCYAELLDRTALCHPAIKVSAFSLAMAARDRPEAVTLFSQALQDRGVATLFDGEKFAWLVPTNRTKTLGATLARGPFQTSTNLVLLPKGAIYLANADLEQALALYGQLLGRRLIRTNNLQRHTISFRNQTDLSKAEVVHAFDVLFAWQGLKVQLVRKDSFQVVAVKGPGN